MAKYDFYFQPKKLEDIDGFKVFTSGFSRSIAVRGPEKLALHWLKRFMTPKGSDPTRPNDGTEFPSLIGSNITQAMDLRDVVVLAIDTCNSQIVSAQRLSQPDPDETFLSASLIAFELTGADSFEAWVRLTNVKQQTIDFSLPSISTRK